jgi:hypothetical protein
MHKHLHGSTCRSRFSLDGAVVVILRHHRGMKRRYHRYEPGFGQNSGLMISGSMQIQNVLGCCHSGLEAQQDDEQGLQVR